MIDEIKTRVRCKDYLTKSKGKMYCCPACGSGTGPHKSGAVSVDEEKNLWHCHSCGAGGSVIDLYMTIHGVTFEEAVSSLAAEYGITGTGNNPRRAGNVEQPKNTTAEEKPQVDLTAYYEECRARLGDAKEYLESRGISLDTARKYGLGFDPAADPAGSGHKAPRLIIPTSPSHYVGRALNDTGEYKKINNKGGSPGILNSAALKTAPLVFVTEGAFDALSIAEAGETAVSLNSTSNRDKLIDILKDLQRTPDLILCLDNDEAGHKAAAELSKQLKEIKIRHRIANVSGVFKDQNEALQADRDGFFRRVKEARNDLTRPDNAAAFLRDKWLEEVGKERQGRSRKTGFKNLDEKTGGLYSDLYILAAGTSLGKTSFLLQLADQVAAAGNDVLYFSLEQSKFELISKSLARITKQDSPAHAVQAIDIRCGLDGRAIADAAKKYSDTIGKNLSIIEGNFDCSARFIRKYTEEYITRNRTRPLVIVDYLQIVTAEDKRIAAIDRVDQTVTALKQMSRDLSVAVVGISSINRASYSESVSFESAKQSGGVEFGAGVFWGLQFAVVSEDSYKSLKTDAERREVLDRERAKEVRRMQLVCKKNRSGMPIYSVNFNYTPKYDLFEEVPEPQGRRRYSDCITL